VGVEISAVFTQMVIFLLLIAIGALGAKAGLLSRDVLRALSSFALHFTIPALVFSTIVNSTDRVTVLAHWYLLPVSFGILGLNYCMGHVSASLCRLSGNTRRIHLCHSTFGNLGMVGVPVLTAVYGAECAVPLMLYLLADQLTLWSVGVRLGYPKETAARHFSLKKFFSPIMVALIAGVAVLALGLKFTGPVMDTITGLASTTRYIAMIYIGGTVIHDLGKAIKSLSAFAIVFFKMLLVPVIVYALLRLSSLCQATDASCFAALAGLPGMGSLSIIARAGGSDDEYAAATTVITTVCAILTLPLVLYLIRLLPF